MGQHYTGQNPMQCCSKGSRQHCIRKNPLQCSLNTLGTTLHSWKPYAMLPKMLHTTLHKENVSFNVSGLCNLGPMQCYCRGCKQHCTGKIQAIEATSGHSLYICIYEVLHVKKYKVILSLLWKSAETKAETAARHSTQQLVKLLVGCCLKKYCQACNVASFCKVSGSRLH